MTTSAESKQGHSQTVTIEWAILEILYFSDTGSDGHVNYFEAQRDIERRGFDRYQFSSTVQQLLNRGVIALDGNTFYLTGSGIHRQTAVEPQRHNQR